MGDSEATGSGTGRNGGGSLRSARAGAKLGKVTADTLADVVLDRGANPVAAFHVLNYIALWGVFVESQGREPRSIRELAELGSQSRATIDRWAGKFRRTFPEYETPAVLWSQVRERIDAPAVDPDRLTLVIGAVAL